MHCIKKTKAEWKDCLSSEQYYVAREGATEMAFSGIYCDHHETGQYHCICCHAALFSSDSKYNSGSGWPSFWQAINKDAIHQRQDSRHGMHRHEIICAQCDAHLGHVFDDGPKPSGLRFCVNSASLDFTKS